MKDYITYLKVEYKKAKDALKKAEADAIKELEQLKLTGVTNTGNDFIDHIIKASDRLDVISHELRMYGYAA